MAGKGRRQVWESESEAGWTDLDLRELRRLGVFQTLRITRRKTHIQL
jgi:hypothetical protein